MAMKTGLAKLEETETAWETLAPNDVFYGTTLAQFKAQVQLSRSARVVVANLEQQLSAALSNKANVDSAGLTLEKNIAKAIAGDPNHGEDSDLYEGTGRVRKSERKTGLTRKKKTNDENK